MKWLWNLIKKLFTGRDKNAPKPTESNAQTESAPGSTETGFSPLVKSGQIVGIDVYHHDKVVSFEEIKKAYDFIIFKVSEGRSHEDTKYKEWVPKARSAGLVVGYYHFFRTNIDPIVQAKSFLSKVKPLLKAGDLCLVCDYETEDDAADGFDILEVEEFCLYIEKELGWTPWIYSGHTLKQSGEAYKVPDRMKKYPLWLAHYSDTRTRPVVPSPWTSETVWQWSETAKVPGVNNSKGTDVNRFNGDSNYFNSLRYKG